MSRHTPGPWVTQNSIHVFTPLGAACADGLEADPNDGWQIANCAQGPTTVMGELVELSFHESRANARLISAAPDLLAALEVSRGQWIHSVNAEQCLAAIAKATGAQP